MTGKKRWRKSWEDKWRDEASDVLGLAGKALRALLNDIAELEEGCDIGWALDALGRPYAPVRLARLLSASEEQVEEAIGQLIDAGVAVRRDGRLGLLGWRKTQEDPSTQRKRDQRDRGAASPRDSHADRHAPNRGTSDGDREGRPQRAGDRRARATGRDGPRDNGQDIPRDSHADRHAPSRGTGDGDRDGHAGLRDGHPEHHALRTKDSGGGPSPEQKREQGVERDGTGTPSPKHTPDLREGDAARDGPRDNGQDIPRDSHAEFHAQRTEDRGQNQEEEEARARAPLTSELATALNRTRRQLGWSERAAAQRAGLADAGTLRRFESGEELPTRRELEALADAYGAPELATLPLPDRDPDVVRAVIHAYYGHAQALGRIAPDALRPEPTPDDLRVVWSTREGPATRQNWLTVLARAAERARRERTTGKASWALDNFALRVLATPRVRKEYLERADLDHQPESRERAPPARSSSPGGPGVLTYRKQPK
jgi:transcriptional regulator with XRE-family HTH domain